MRELHLTQGKIALISDEDFDRVSQYRWCASNNARPHWAPKWYGMRKALVGRRRLTLYLHRYIVAGYDIIPEGMVVDHIDGDTLNNQRENLRVVSHFENTKHAMYRARPIAEPWL